MVFPTRQCQSVWVRRSWTQLLLWVRTRISSQIFATPFFLPFTVVRRSKRAFFSCSLVVFQRCFDASVYSLKFFDPRFIDLYSRCHLGFRLHPHTEVIIALVVQLILNYFVIHRLFTILFKYSALCSLKTLLRYLSIDVIFWSRVWLKFILFFCLTLALNSSLFEFVRVSASVYNWVKQQDQTFIFVYLPVLMSLTLLINFTRTWLYFCF